MTNFKFTNSWTGWRRVKEVFKQKKILFDNLRTVISFIGRDYGNTVITALCPRICIFSDFTESLKDFKIEDVFTLSFGKYKRKGITYGFMKDAYKGIRENEYRSYCRWAVTVEKPAPTLRHFRDYLRKCNQFKKDHTVFDFDSDSSDSDSEIYT
jgi:hypothetical protein